MNLAGESATVLETRHRTSRCERLGDPRLDRMGHSGPFHAFGERLSWPALPYGSEMMTKVPEACSTDTNDTEANRVNPAAAIIGEVRTRLGRHSHFHLRTSEITVEFDGHTLILKGQLPSFYLKQLLQECLRDIAGVVNLNNRVDVIGSSGVRSVREIPDAARHEED